MATASIPYTFSNNTQNADATQVNSNFSTLATFLNTEVIQRDGTIAFTQIPTLPATSPTNANHATRKGYVDSYFPVATANIADLGVTTAKVADSAITSAKIADGAIVNADVNASAAIAYSKLNLASSIVAADFAAAAKPVVICTSSTRPSSPVNGQMIFETDTGKVLVYYSTPAQWRQPWNLPWGVAGATSYATPQTIGSGGASSLVAQCSFTVVANRQYHATVTATRIATNSATIEQGVLFQIDTSGAFANGGFQQLTGNTNHMYSGACFMSSATGGTAGLTAGTRTFKVLAGTAATSLLPQWQYQNYETHIVINDIGPANNTPA